MSKLRILSGHDLIQIFSAFGFHAISQRGSHLKLRRVLPDVTGKRLRLSFTMQLTKKHSALSTGQGFAT